MTDESHDSRSVHPPGPEARQGRRRTATHSDGVITLETGRRVGVVQFGDHTGAPVVWCHGGLSSRIDAALVAGAAARHGFRLIAFDRPGVGRSTRDPDDGLLGWPGIVAACADHLGLATFAVAGWSAGGAFALACAFLLPERVRATATVAGVYPVDDPARRDELGLALDRRLIRLSQRSSHAARIALEPLRLAPDGVRWRSTLRSCGPAERAALVPETRSTVVRMGREAFRQGTAGVVGDYRAWGSAWGFALHDIPAPVTVFHGEADSFVPLAHAERLAEDLPAGSLVRIPDAGHFLHATHGELILSSLRSAAG